MKESNKISGIVDHVIGPNRFKISIPRESLKLTLVLGGLANFGNRDDPLSKIALDFVNKRAYQRDVQFDIYGTDKTGAFIGNLYLPGAHTPLQTTLLANGFAETHERSVAQTKFASQLLEAEREAQAKKLGVWKDYDPSQVVVEDLSKQVQNLKIEKKYYDVQVTEVSQEGLVSFQFINPDQKKLHGFMQKFHSASSTFKPLTRAPKVGEFVAARFSDNGKFYRAKVIAIDRPSNKFKIQQIDYGTVELTSLFDLKTLPSEFSVTAYKPQAHTVQLSLIALPTPTNYHQDAIYLLEDLVLDKQMVACETFKNPAPGVEMDVEFYDPKTIPTDPTLTVNKELVKSGCAIVKKKSLAAFESLLRNEQKSLLELENKAKKSHIGCWEFGDIEGDEDIA
ncbi:unnamed protein product [Ambrosiozyma monospora]|uniref:Unnamed protein product n=1 Tax=Ambrosiozyma monospora TaxID=43982 RepID=A0ACB5T8F4_AMBMO|nr:unnamed protein product [Ambrosiozyma monospora]